MIEIIEDKKVQLFMYCILCLCILYVELPSLFFFYISFFFKNIIPYNDKYFNNMFKRKEVIQKWEWQEQNGHNFWIIFVIAKHFQDQCNSVGRNVHFKFNLNAIIVDKDHQQRNRKQGIKI